MLRVYLHNTRDDEKKRKRKKIPSQEKKMCTWSGGVEFILYDICLHIE